MVGHAYNPSNQEAQAGGSLRVPDECRLEASWNFVERPCLKVTKKTLGAIQPLYFTTFQRVEYNICVTGCAWYRGRMVFYLLVLYIFVNFYYFLGGTKA